MFQDNRFAVGETKSLEIDHTARPSNCNELRIRSDRSRLRFFEKDSTFVSGTIPTDSALSVKLSICRSEVCKPRIGATNVPIPGRNTSLPSAIMLETTLLAGAPPA